MSLDDILKRLEEIKKNPKGDVIVTKFETRVFIEGKLDGEIGILEGLRTKNQMNDTLFCQLGICYFEAGNIKKAVEVLEEARTKNQTNPDTFTILSYLYSDSNIPKAIDILEDSMKLGYVNSSTLPLMDSLINEKTRLLNTLEIIKKEDNKDYLAYAFLADHTLKHGLIEGKDRNDYIRLMVRQMRKNNEFETGLTDYKKASHKIKILKGGNVLSDTIVVKEGDKPFDKEKEIRDELEKLFGDGLSLPTYIGHFEDNGKYYYVMKRENGESLTDLIKTEVISSKLYHTLLFIVIPRIQVLFPLKVLDYNYNMQSRLEKVMRKTLEENLAQQYVQHCRPIIDILSKSKNMCYNKDSSPENWMFTKEGKIVMLDTEDKGIIPYALDVATFLNFIPYLSFKERIKRADGYVFFLNSVCEECDKPDRRIKDKDQFMKEYCNAVIYRAIIGSSYLLSQGRSEDEEKLRQTGIQMIDHMQKHKMIKPEHKENYAAIEKLLIKEIS